jgi:hypothetical protein
MRGSAGLLGGCRHTCFEIVRETLVDIASLRQASLEEATLSWLTTLYPEPYRAISRS